MTWCHIILIPNLLSLTVKKKHPGDTHQLMWKFCYENPKKMNIRRKYLIQEHKYSHGKPNTE